MKLIRTLVLLLMPASIFAQRIDKKLDLVYTSRGEWQGKLDLYLPANKPDNALVIYVHGGGWTHGRKEAEYEKIKVFIEHGYAVANVEYRLAGQAPAPAALEDVRCAIRYLLEHSADFNLNTKKYVLMGGSAGGHLALLAGLNPGHAGECSLKGFRPAAIISKYGPTDLLSWKPAMDPGSASSAWLAARRLDTAFVKSMSPTNFAGNLRIPVLFVHGDQDKTVPIAQSQMLYDKMKDRGAPVEMYVVRGGRHGNFGPVETPKMDERMIAFLRKYL